MAYPPRYDRQADFSAFQTANPTQPLPAGAVEAELDTVSAALNAVRAFLMGALTAEGRVPGTAPPDIAVSGFAEGLLGQPDEAAWLTELGFAAFVQGLLAAADAPAFRALISAAGTDDIGLTLLRADFGNAVANGDFRLNQAGVASVTATTGTPADNARVSAQGGTRLVRRVALSDADRAAVGRDEAEFAVEYQAAGGGAAGDFEQLQVAVPGVRSLAGRRVALAFWARRSAGVSGSLSTEFVQVFGTGGTPSADVTTIAPTKHALTSSWQRFVVYADIPSTAGKTVGTGGNDDLKLIFWFSAGSSFDLRTLSLGQQNATFQVADLVLVPVPAAASPSVPAFSPRPPGVEPLLVLGTVGRAVATAATQAAARTAIAAAPLLNPPFAGVVTFGDSNFNAQLSGDPLIFFDAGDYIGYDRTGDQFTVRIGNTERLRVSASELVVPFDMDVAGAAEFAQRPTVGGMAVGVNLGVAQNTTAGTAIDFTGIPTGVRRVTVMFSNVSTSGSSSSIVRLGTSGGVEATGYASTSAALPNGSTSSTTDSTTGFSLRGGAGSDVRHGILVLQRLTGNTWSAIWVVTSSSANVTVGAGSIVLPGELDRARITTAGGTDTFDLGTINVSWEM